MNVWADQTTNRYLTEEPPVADVYPDQFVATSEQPFWELLTSAFGRLIAFNPVLTTSFQSINAAGIVFFAPVFAWLWVYLARRNLNPSIATKMAIGVFFQGIAFALMIWAAKYANGPSETDISQLPSVVLRDGDKVFFPRFTRPDRRQGL
ncbi:MAG: hypothetical protein IPK83_16680 [Planctomycetes bacterium]|nr:hypothetical protein [Planctomycetota bacterium]